VQGLLFAGIPELAESLQTVAFGQTRFAAQATEVAGKLFTRLNAIPDTLLLYLCWMGWRWHPLHN
jgi:hypothetical protein